MNQSFESMFESMEKTISGMETNSSRIPGFYRLSVEQRLAFLARRFGLSEEQVDALRSGGTLRIENAVNMVENVVGVLGMPLGLGLNFLVDGCDLFVPMAIEEASIVAAASKAALLVRGGGGFFTRVNEPIMIGQIQVENLEDPVAAANELMEKKHEVITEANSVNPRMVIRGGGAFDLETRIVDCGEENDGLGNVGKVLVVHLLINVCEAMGANAVNYACEAAGPMIEKITGGRALLQIVSNYADRCLARAEFTLPVEHLAMEGLDGAEVARRLVMADRLARTDPYRAATHNKGIFNGICATAIALGQDWRAIEAGGHAYAARDGLYRGLTSYRIKDGYLHAELELPFQVGWVGGAVNSHPGVKLLRTISGIRNSTQLAGLMAAVGLGQNLAALLALCTAGIQRGHMALHARSVAVSVGVPPENVEAVTKEMIRRNEVKVAVAEEIYRNMREKSKPGNEERDLPVESFAPGKVVLFGEHAVVYNNSPGISAAISSGLTVTISKDPDGPRFLNPQFKQVFPVPESDKDIRLLSKASDLALEMYGLDKEGIAIDIKSDLVPGMGLGSSAAFSVALCTALRRFKGLDHTRRWDNGLFKEVQKLEEIFHGSPSGMDAATILSDGVLWFRKGPPRELLPLRLSRPLTGIVCLVEPAVRTIDMVERVRRRREKNPETMNCILSDIGNLTVDAGIALGTGDVTEAGRLMFRNHELLAKLGVSTPALDRAVKDLLDAGVLGAKLTGGGGGGAVVALVKASDQMRLVDELSGEFPLVLPFALGTAT